MPLETKDLWDVVAFGGDNVDLFEARSIMNDNVAVSISAEG
jgi:hypothetical protein